MTTSDKLIKLLNDELGDYNLSFSVAFREITIVCPVNSLLSVMMTLRDDSKLQFNQLIDVCAVDYLKYGISDWQTDSATETGFSRGVEPQQPLNINADRPRYAIVYHLLSTIYNQRLRVKVYVDEALPVAPSVINIWKSANWFEREAYDLYGILFDGHPDLRRILTDYGFIGHPFKKDFPLSGHVEMRYDATQKKVIYEPVDIEPRITVPKVIRDDNRYSDLQGDLAQ